MRCGFTPRYSPKGFDLPRRLGLVGCLVVLAGALVAPTLADSLASTIPCDPGRAFVASATQAPPAGPRTWHLLGSLSDPPDNLLAPELDILAARVEQEGGRLTFTIDVRGPIPTELPNPDDTITYLWFIDTDENPGTGQPHGGLGSEFNVRAVIGELYGGGFVDVTGGEPGGGPGTVAVNGNTVSVTIWLSELNVPADFNWRSASFAVIGSQYVPGNADTQIIHSDTLPYTTPARIATEPPLLMLCPSGPATGQLQVVLRDAEGNPLPPGDHLLAFHSTNEQFATVDASGLVTAIAVPQIHWQTPYIEVWADGVMADNAAVVRINNADLGLDYRYYRGNQTIYYIAPTVEGVDLDAIMRDYEVGLVTERAYGSHEAAVGNLPTGGGYQYLVLDVADVPDAAICGASGNPIRLGWLWGPPANNSCFIINDPSHRRPQWFVIFHELGHDFTCACNSFNLFCMGPSGPHNVAYNEGLASLAALWSWHAIVDAPAGLGATALDDLDEHFQFYAGTFRQSLADYQAAGADYDAIDPNVVDGILLEMDDAYGLIAWFNLFSTFLPHDAPLPVALNTIEKQADWFVAAMSVTAGEDLRSLFAGEYGFPLDDVAWPEILSAVQQRIEARSWSTGIEDPGAHGPAATPGTAIRLVGAPNPFGRRTEIRFTLAQGGRVSATVHDVTGRWIARLFDGVMPAGERTLSWDGRVEHGRTASPGLYLIRLTTPSGVGERRVTRIE